VGPEEWAAGVAEGFHVEHERQYSRRFDGAVHLVNLRTMAVGRRPPLRWPELEPGDGDVSGAQVHEQEVVFVVGGRREAHATRFYDRALLRAGDVVDGAAVIEQFDSTTVVSPGMSARVDPHGNLIVEAR
jgi:5-oxoprolinase (ATP-hydrolysing)/N-methylhydantoinase A